MPADFTLSFVRRSSPDAPLLQRFVANTGAAQLLVQDMVEDGIIETVDGYATQSFALKLIPAHRVRFLIAAAGLTLDLD